MMFEYLLLENLGIFSRLEWQNHQKINIIIGENDTGKTYILKMLYCRAKQLLSQPKGQEFGFRQILEGLAIALLLKIGWTLTAIAQVLPTLVDIDLEAQIIAEADGQDPTWLTAIQTTSLLSSTGLDFGQKGKFAYNLREQKLRHHKFPQLFFKLSPTELNG